MPGKNKPIITLNLAGEETDFYSTDELSAWASTEQDAWSWLNEILIQDKNFHRLWEIMQNLSNAIFRFVKIVNNHPDDENTQSQIKNELINATNESMEQNFCLSYSPIGKFVIALKDEHSPLISAYALVFLMELDIDYNSHISLEGAYRALQFLHGSKDTVDAHQKSLDSMKRTWSSKFGKQHKVLIEKIDAIESNYQALRNKSIGATKEFQQQTINQQAEFQNHLKKAKEQLEDISRIYDEKLALQSSVAYWTNKKTFHKNLAIAFGIATPIFAIIIGVGLSWFVLMFLTETVSKVPLWKFGIALVISTIGIWLIRLLAKIFISNLDLSTEADERVTMIKTYLALLREGTGPQENERQLILQTLFRPSSTGLIKEDQSLAWHEHIADRLKR